MLIKKLIKIADKNMPTDLKEIFMILNDVLFKDEKL